ncbi:hypothetical protein [Klebsiella pneumoniae IS39]|nr:hypothetical protein [Klebsiella pneumoniae IS39]
MKKIKNEKKFSFLTSAALFVALFANIALFCDQTSIFG